MKQVFVIFGRLPIKGFSKTRLAKDVGEELALLLYNAFIKDFFQGLNTLNFDKIYVFGTPNKEETEKFFCKELLPKKIQYIHQIELPFFQRLREVFKKIREVEGECFIHLTGTDIPDFPFEEIKRLVPRPNTIYLGPDIDGGFYYVGGEAKFDGIFEFEITGSISESIAQKVLSLGLEVSHLKTWSDIDDLADLEAAIARTPQEKISHTRALWPH